MLKSRVTLTLMPRNSSSSAAGTPSAVPGILIIRFGRPTSFARCAPSAMDARRIPRQQRRDLQADEAVDAARFLVDRQQRVAGVADVLAGEVLVDLQRRPAAPRAAGDLLVVGGAAADGLAEDGRVGGDAAQAGVADLAREVPAAEQVPGEIVHPVALPVVGQFAQAVHVCLSSQVRAIEKGAADGGYLSK